LRLVKYIKDSRSHERKIYVKFVSVNVVKVCRVLEVKIHSFLTSGPDRVSCWFHVLVILPPRIIDLSAHKLVGWVGCRLGLALWRSEVSCQGRESNHDFLVIQPIAYSQY